MADILGIVLKAIGGQKLTQVGSVFAEGSNITRQLPGGTGLGSLLNKVPSLSQIMSSSGISGVFNNPVGSVMNTITANVQAAVGPIAALTTSTTNSSTNQTTTSPVYPQFSAALASAQTTFNTFSTMASNLSGQTVPDYNNDEFGIVDALNFSSDGSASLTDLTAPIQISTTVQASVSAIQLLLQNVQSKSVSDANAVLQLQNILLPFTTAISTSVNAYNVASQQQGVQTILAEALSYVNNSASSQDVYVQSLMLQSLATEVAQANIDAQAEVNANRAEARKQRQEQLKFDREVSRLLADQSEKNLEKFQKNL